MGIHQYVYRLYENNGNEIPTTTGFPEGTTIYNNFIENLAVLKLGIKAPPGTAFVINGTGKFIVGPSGVFNINKPGYKITSLYFLRPVSLSKDTEKTEEYLENGIKAMDQAITEFLNNSKATILAAEGININDAKTITVIHPKTNEEIEGDLVSIEEIVTNSELYYGIYSEFIKNFTQGYQEYSLGVKGIYKQAEEKDLQNIIIDVEFEEAQTQGEEGGNA